MSPKFSITKSANRDIEEIADYLSKQVSFDRAEAFIHKLDAQFSRIAKFPNIGRQRNDISDNVRALSVDSYVVVYIPVGRDVEILRVVSRFRNLQTLFDN